MIRQIIFDYTCLQAAWGPDVEAVVSINRGKEYSVQVVRWEPRARPARQDGAAWVTDSLVFNLPTKEMSLRFLRQHRKAKFTPAIFEDDRILTGLRGREIYHKILANVERTGKVDGILEVYRNGVWMPRILEARRRK